VLQLSFNQRRLAVGVALFVCLACCANYYLLEPGFLPNFKKKLMVLGFAVLGVVVLYIGPTVEEIRRYRELKSGGANDA
jgi:hypothetical protein